MKEGFLQDGCIILHRGVPLKHWSISIPIQYPGPMSTRLLEPFLNVDEGWRHVGEKRGLMKALYKKMNDSECGREEARQVENP